MIDVVRDLCVISTRAKHHFIYVASMEYMIDNCQTWRPAIHHIQGDTAGPSYNYSFFHILFVLLFNKYRSVNDHFDSNDNFILYYSIFDVISYHLKLNV